MSSRELVDFLLVDNVSLDAILDHVDLLGAALLLNEEDLLIVATDHVSLDHVSWL